MTEAHPLAPYLRRFLLEEVRIDRHLSRNTQCSYRDTMRLLLRFMDDHQATAPTRVTVEQITPELVRHFLTFLEQERHSVPATCNQRRAALHALFRFIARQTPELVDHAAQIHALPARRTVAPVIDYLEKNEIDAVLAVPDRQHAQGQRDYALLLFLYNTGARASEAAHITVDALRLHDPPSARLVGKGGKTRVCPLWPRTAATLQTLLGSRRSVPPDAPVFLNIRGQPLTRFGIHTLVERTVAKAAVTLPALASKHISPHTVRHTTAVHLLRAGVDINTIRAWLGHVSLATTNRYAQVDLAMKAKALATCEIRAATESPRSAPAWRTDDQLMAFLTSL